MSIFQMAAATELHREVRRLRADNAAMLAMLKKLVECNGEFRAELPADWESDPLNDLCMEANAVIAKAEGRTDGNSTL